MSLAIFISITMGIASLLQGGINRQIASQWGFVGAAFLNTLVILVIVSALYVASRWYPDLLPKVLHDRGSFSRIQWWYIIPGLAGLFLILGMPWVISKIGALNLFMGFVSAQLAGSLIWDACMEGIPLSAIRVTGVALSFVAVWLVSWK